MSFAANFSNYADSLSYPGVRLPDFQFDQDDLNEWGIKETNPDEILKILCRNGYKKFKIDEKENKDKYVERVKYELETIKKLGFAQYLLIVYDMTLFCDKNNIPRGPGRGSGAGCLILYLLNCTKIDPVKYDLFFERFINETRAKFTEIDGIKYYDGKLLMDYDCDFSYIRRQEIIDNYLNIKFKDRTCKILNISTLGSRSTIKEVGKVFLEMGESQLIGLSESIDSIAGTVATISESLNGDEKKGIKKNRQLIEFAEKYPEGIEIALKIEDLAKSYSSHASGFLISNGLMEDMMPMQLSVHNEIVSSYDMESALEICLKLDILGLKTLDLIYDTAKDANIDLDSLDPEDESIYRDLEKLIETPYGLFQISGDTNLSTIKRVKVKNFAELTACTALARPGATAFIDEYAERNPKPLHPLFDEILKETYGVCIYQETMMKLAVAIGFNLLEAETLRRIVGKKKVEEVKEWQEKIRLKTEQNNLPENLGQLLWNILEASAKYSFNVSHSRVYSLLGYQTLYLKKNFPLFFYKNALKYAVHEQNPHHCINQISAELPKFNIKLSPPSLHKGNVYYDADLETNTIYAGLSSLRGFSDKTITKLPQFIKTQKSNKFEVFLAAEQAGINISSICNLIKAGCLSEFGENRAKLVLECKSFHDLSDKEKGKILEIGAKYDFDLFRILCDVRDGKLNGIMKIEKKEGAKRESRYTNYYKLYADHKLEYQEALKNIELDNFTNENTVLGYSFSTTLSDCLRSQYNDLIKIKDIDSKEDDEMITFSGIIQDSYFSKTTKGKDFQKVFVSDETKQITCLIWDNIIKSIRQINGTQELAKDWICVVRGKKKGNAIFVDNLRLIRKI